MCLNKEQKGPESKKDVTSIFLVVLEKESHFTHFPAMSSVSLLKQTTRPSERWQIVKVSDVAASKFDAVFMAVPVHVSVNEMPLPWHNLETSCCLQTLSSSRLITRPSSLAQTHSCRLTSPNLSSLCFIAGKHKAEHLLSFARLPPAHTPTDETQRGSGVLSQIHNAELMGVDGGGVTVSASVSLQLSAAVGGF